MPPSCQASSPQIVLTCVPSAFSWTCAGEKWLPTTTRPTSPRAARRRRARRPAAWTSCGSSRAATPENRWYSAMHRVRLAAAEVGLQLMTGWPPVPATRCDRRLTARASPSVRYVRSKNAPGPRTPGRSSPLPDLVEVGGELGGLKLPEATSSCGWMTSRHGFSPDSARRATLDVALDARSFALPSRASGSAQFVERPDGVGLRGVDRLQQRQIAAAASN